MSATSPDASGSRALRSEELAAAQRAFKTVFRTFDPLGSPFKPSVHGRLLVYEPDVWKTHSPWGLSTGDLGVLLRVADDHDLERVFVSMVDPHDERWDESQYVLSPLSVDSYTHPGPMDAWPIVPHAIYPPSVRGASSRPTSRTPWWAVHSGSSTISRKDWDEARTR